MRSSARWRLALTVIAAGALVAGWGLRDATAAPLTGLSAKLAVQQRIDADTVAARASARPTENPSFAPPGRTLPPIATGLLQNNPPPLPRETIDWTGTWVGLVGSQYVAVYAGA